MSSRTLLIGRDTELDELGGLVAAARNGAGQSLRLLGEPGIGKTALIDAVIERAAAFRVLRVDGYEAERILPYAGVQRLLDRLGTEWSGLPEPEEEALAIACGRRSGQAPDRFLVGRALLALLAATAQEQPVLCAIDDAQWMDPESLDALGFVARRLHAEALLLLFATREDPAVDVHFGGIPHRPVPELERAAAIGLLTDRLGTRFDPRVAAGIVDDLGGNPLALSDLADEMSNQTRPEPSLPSAPLGAGPRLERLYQRQVRALPSASQQWILLAAAESTGDLRLIDHAATALGIGEHAGESADSAGLVVIDGVVRFRHPLIRAAVYGAAPAADRRRVHGALARAAAALHLDDAEARHAAEAAARPDEQVATQLAAAAVRAARRGGLLSQAKLLSKAAELTVDATIRYERLLAAAEAAAEAGAGPAALDLLDRVDAEALTDPVLAGRRLMLRATLSVFTLDAQLIPHATRDLATAAELFHGLDRERELLALLHAFEVALPAERCLRGITVAELGARMRAAVTPDDGLMGTVLTGLAALILDPYEEAIGPMRAAVAALAELEDPRILLFGNAGVALTTALWDERARDRHLDTVERVAVTIGALKAVDLSLWVRSLCDLDRGDVTTAGRTIERVRDTRRAMGYPAEHVINSAYLAWTGADRTFVEQLAEATLVLGFGGVHTSTTLALAIRDLAESRYDEAFDTLTALRPNAFLQTGPLQLPEYVEAATRSGHPAEAQQATAELLRIAASSQAPWARGVGERCLALSGPAAQAESHFQAALEILTTTDTPGDLYRTHLLYGEWLRRKRRRKEAGLHLRRAFDGFQRAGTTAFAARAQRELAALGDKPAPAETPSTPSRLTVQESQVATLAAAGATNAEIAATLFISPNTVDYHLRKVFRKLDISSRRQLRELPETELHA
ncbi:AAA family ATPase [Nocardia yamanashiensis]|uniref:helix-turn-helix transcriptional regulator n=1 Tax=Nocardia yamanashiensis TaxID=209247 RepID=UPI001E329D99|nr:AAA family ATPase [Nocardia yamanashiensis]UGT44092.1 AAA family ATPase [Nocardia yamanashiensis]